MTRAQALLVRFVAAQGGSFRFAPGHNTGFAKRNVDRCVAEGKLARDSDDPLTVHLVARVQCIALTEDGTRCKLVPALGGGALCKLHATKAGLVREEGSAASVTRRAWNRSRG